MISTVPMITNAGRALLLRAIAGETLTFTRLAIGSGTLLEDQDRDELTALIHEELSITPAELDDSQAGLLAISGDFTSADIESDFVWRELGVYAQGEDEIEVLYAYANDGESAGTLRAITSAFLAEEKVTLIVEIDDAENVTAIFNPHTQYAEATTLAGHMNNRNNPHAVTKEQIGLGNVVNKSPENTTVSFTAASERTNITTGEKLSVMFGKIAKVLSDAITHIGKTTGNPHSVTKADVGLGNVVNVAPSNMEITFTEADEESENLDADNDLFSGSKASVLFTRVARAVNNLIEHIGTTTGNPHGVTKTDVGLGDVENTAPSFNIVNFEPRNSFSIPETGETMSTMMSKVAKDLTDLQTHMDTSETSNPHNVKLSDIAVADIYVGNGVQGRVIALDFTPSAVQLWDEYGRYFDAEKGVCGGFAISTRGVRATNSQSETDATTWSDDYTALMCVENGFKVNFVADSISTNDNGVTYHYVAYK